MIKATYRKGFSAVLFKTAGFDSMVLGNQPTFLMPQAFDSHRKGRPFDYYSDGDCVGNQPPFLMPQALIPTERVSTLQ
jgi:hypothetical protein